MCINFPGGSRSAVRLSRAWISRIESGTADVRLDALDRLAIAFGFSVSELLSELPEDPGEVDDDELVRRAAAPRSEKTSAPDSSSTPWIKPQADPLNSETRGEADLAPYDLRFDPRVATRIERFGDNYRDFAPP